MRVQVLWQNCPHSISQLKQVLCVSATWAGGVDYLVGNLLQRSRAEVVWIVLRANVEQCLAGRWSEGWTVVKGHCDDLITTFFSVIEVVLYFLLPTNWELVSYSPNTPLKKSQRKKASSSACASLSCLTGTSISRP